MAYQLNPGEPVPEGLRRIASEEIEAAAIQLAGREGVSRDEAIHEARKSVKKLRGLLRLIRTELGALYRAESRRLRDIGRELSRFRDAGAMVETFDDLKEKFQDELGRLTLASIRRGLLKRKRESERAAGIESVLQNMAATLRAAGGSVKDWPLATEGFAALAPGLERAFRRSRNAFGRARKNPGPEELHEWRKRVKDHWYQVRLLAAFWTPEMEGYEKDLRDLQNWLGDDHNLHLLGEMIAADPDSYGTPRSIERCADLIDKYRKELRDKALEHGRRIYREKPREYVERLSFTPADRSPEPASPQ